MRNQGTSSSPGFTLLEMLVAIAVGSMVLIACFEIWAQTDRLVQLFSSENHNRQLDAALTHLLYADLTNHPQTEPKLVGTQDEIRRTTVSYESEDRRVLDTRVRYQVRDLDDGNALVRDWKWVDLQNQFHNSEQLLTADRISFEFRLSTGEWVNSIPTETKIHTIRLNVDDRNYLFPVNR